MSGKLFLCATPIGNLKDITLRVIETLKTVDLIAAEDTRNTKKLLNHYDIHTRLTSYHEHNKYDKADELIKILLEGQNVALVTDAGTPGISDPGEELVKKCYDANVEVTSLPGASAFVTALSMSGLSSRRFVFEGFLPADNKELNAALERIKNEVRTIVIYEAPHRLLKTLKTLLKILGNREIRICRELTKIHEEVVSLTLEEAIKKYEDVEPRGEMVILLQGADEEELKKEKEAGWNKMSLKDHMSIYIDRGFEEKEAMRKVAKDRGVSRRDIYDQLKK